MVVASDAFKGSLTSLEVADAVRLGLLDRDDVALLPHVGSATVETRTAMADLAIANVLAVLDGQDPLTPVRG